MATTTATVNPEWRAAIDAAMHESIMNRDAPAAAAPPPRTPTPPPPKNPRVAPPPAPHKARRGLAPFRFRSTEDNDDEDDDEDSLEDIAPPPRTKLHDKRRAYEEEEEEEEDEDDMFGDEDEEEEDEDEDEDEDDAPASVRSRMRENEKISEEEKLDMLSRLDQLVNEQGYKPVRILTPQDSIEDVRYELFRAEREVARKRAIRSYQKNLVTASVFMEMAANHFGMLNLNGFSKSVLLSIQDYTDTLDDLHTIYKDSFRVRPEVRLVWQLGSSAYLYSLAGGNSAETKVRAAAATSASTHPPVPQRTMGGPSIKPSNANAPPTSPDLAGLAMLTQLLGR